MSEGEDPLVSLEDFSKPEVVELIKAFNREVEEAFGAEVERHYKRILELAKVPRAAGAALLRSGVLVLYKGLTDEVWLLKWNGERVKLFTPPEGEVVTGIARVELADDLLAVYTSVEGADEGAAYVVDARSSEMVCKIDGVTRNLCALNGALVYVRSYRREPPPDGGAAPTDRIVELRNGEERLVWGSGSVKAGEWIHVLPSPDGRKAAITVGKGWARSRLYVADTGSWSEELAEEGDYAISVVGWTSSPVYLRAKPEGDELVVDGSAEALERPVEHALTSDGSLLLVELADARHRLRFSRLPFKGWKEVEMPARHLTVTRVDALEGRFLVLATSPVHRHLIALVEDGAAKPVEVSEAVQGVEVVDLWLRSGDGVRVHGFLITKQKQPKAVLLYGYGGFGVSLTPTYSTLFHHLLELGCAVAVVNARGGREEGEAWHRAAMLEGKEKTFEDFAAFARFFKLLGFKVAAYGSSNGGLTVAAVATRWPELLDAAVVGYPVLDMLRYHLLYVGRYWVPEYGDPEDPKMREVLLRYSPYHNVPRDRRMPPTLVYTGLNDDRVHPAHALKFAVKAKQLGHPVFLRVEERSGHSGARTEVKALEAAYMAAFLDKILCVSEKPEERGRAQRISAAFSSSKRG
jgi:prolyl oligopeptidase